MHNCYARSRGHLLFFLSSSFSFPSLRTTSSIPLPIFLPSTSPCLLSYSHLFSLFFFFFLYSYSPVYAIPTGYWLTASR